MLRPSIFGESLFDDWMDDFPFGKEFEKEMFPEKSPLYGKHAKNMMKTDVRETNEQEQMSRLTNKPNAFILFLYIKLFIRILVFS